MIISRTPFRISFVGGGSDLRVYYRHGMGAVVSTAIKKYMYITVNRRFDDAIRVSYTKTEIVDRIDQLQHELVREALRLAGLRRGIEITTVADVPAGTGLGSSSSLTVGLLNALYAYVGKNASVEELARAACRIEIEILKKPIGKQDQYIAAYGGLQFIQFNCDETVHVEPIICKEETKQRLQDNLLMFYTGQERDSWVILSDQRDRMINGQEELKILSRMVDLAKCFREELSRDRIESVGELLRENWELKKQLSPLISTPFIDQCYERAMEAGASGGKLAGAGGGGFLVFYCEQSRQTRFRAAMQGLGLRELEFHFEPQGSNIFYIG